MVPVIVILYCMVTLGQFASGNIALGLLLCLPIGAVIARKQMTSGRRVG